MLHVPPLVSTIAIGLVLAFAFGVAGAAPEAAAAGRLSAWRASPSARSRPGSVADQNIANQLAEVGVILLMFGVGLHFSLKDLLSVRAIAVPGALAQGLVATPLGMAVGWLLGWSLGAGLIFGIALSVASTVVLLRVLQERRLLETERGRITVGWLIVQDIAMVLVLVLLPGLAALFHGVETAPARSRSCARSASCSASSPFSSPSCCSFGKKLIPAILHYVAHTGSRELFRLAVLSIALGCRLRRGRAVRHLARAGRLLRRHDAERVAIEPAGRHRVAAVARRLRRAVLRLGRHAVRSGDAWSTAPLALLATVAHHPDRQIGRRLFRRASVRALALDGADDHRLAGADRRILVHPRRSQPAARPVCRRRAAT